MSDLIPSHEYVAEDVLVCFKSLQDDIQMLCHIIEEGGKDGLGLNQDTIDHGKKLMSEIRTTLRQLQESFPESSEKFAEISEFFNVESRLGNILLSKSLQKMNSLNKLALVTTLLSSMLISCMRGIAGEAPLTRLEKILPDPIKTLVPGPLDQREIAFGQFLSQISGPRFGEEMLKEYVENSINYLKKRGLLQQAYEYALLGYYLGDGSRMKNFGSGSNLLEVRIIEALIKQGVTPTKIQQFDKRFTLSEIGYLVEILGEKGVYANAFSDRYTVQEIAQFIQMGVSLKDVDAYFSSLSESVQGARLQPDKTKTLFDFILSHYSFKDIDPGILTQYHAAFFEIESWFKDFLLDKGQQDIPALFLCANRISPDQANFYYTQLQNNFAVFEIATFALYDIPLDVIQSYVRGLKCYENILKDNSSVLDAQKVSQLMILEISPHAYAEQIFKYYELLQENCKGENLETIYRNLVSKGIPYLYAVPLLKEGQESRYIFMRYIKSKLSDTELSTLKTEYNIDDEFLYRYDIKTLQELLKNLNPEYENHNKIALIILPKSDYNEAFRNIFVEFTALTEAGYKVFMYETGNKIEMLQACQKFATIGRKPIDYMILVGHGRPDALMLGPDPAYGHMQDKDVLLAVSDGNLFQQIQMSMKPGSQITLLSCSTGQKLVGSIYESMPGIQVMGPQKPVYFFTQLPSMMGTRLYIYPVGGTVILPRR